MTIPRLSEDKLLRITETELHAQMKRLAEQYGYPGTPNNETTFSEMYFNEWFRIFKPYTHKQVEKAISAHIEAEDSLKGVFPLPGRIKKLIRKDEDESRLFQEQIIREEEMEKHEMTDEEKARLEREHNERMADPGYRKLMAMITERTKSE